MVDECTHHLRADPLAGDGIVECVVDARDEMRCRSVVLRPGAADRESAVTDHVPLSFDDELDLGSFVARLRHAFDAPLELLPKLR